MCAGSGHKRHSTPAPSPCSHVSVEGVVADVGGGALEEVDKDVALAHVKVVAHVVALPLQTSTGIGTGGGAGACRRRHEKRGALLSPRNWLANWLSRLHAEQAPWVFRSAKLAGKQLVKPSLPTTLTFFFQATGLSTLPCPQPSLCSPSETGCQAACQTTTLTFTLPVELAGKQLVTLTPSPANDPHLLLPLELAVKQLDKQQPSPSLSQ